MARRFLAIAFSLVTIEAAAAICPIPLQPTKTAFVATVWIGSHGPFRFLVDTGATTTVVDRRVAEAIGIQPARTIEAITSTGRIQVLEAVVRELRAGAEVVTDTPVLIVDLPPFPNHGRLDGILGMSIFSGRAVMLDLQRRCLEIDAASPSGTTIEGHEIAGRMAIEVGGLHFILDSGASFPVLTSPRARALAIAGGAMEITTAGGRQQLTMATIPILRVGGRTLRDVTVALAPATDSRHDGLLPISPFKSVYIAADRKSVIVN